MFRRRADVVLATLATGWIAWSVWHMPRWTVDDAFIVARYADNLVSRGRLVFDVTAPERVEGFTSPFGMLLAVLARAASADAIGVTKVAGVLSALAWPALVVALARACRSPPGAGGVASLLTALLPQHAVHAASGLETEIFATSSLALLVASARVMRRPFSHERTFAVAALVTALVRPEGIAAAFLFVTTAALVRRHTRHAVLALLRSVAAIVVVPLGAVTIARACYFGSLLPNTFAAKRIQPNQAHLTALGSLLAQTFVSCAVVAIALLLAARLIGAHARPPSRTERAVVVASAGLLVVHIVGYLRAEPIMDYGLRFAWHSLAFVTAFVMASAGLAIRVGKGSPRVLAPCAVVMLVLAGTTDALRSREVAAHDRSWVEAYERTVRELYAPAIAWIEAHTPADAVIAVYPDAGRVPYETRRPSIDFGRLNDRALARSHSDAEVVDYFFARDPNVLVVSQPSALSGGLYDSGADAIVADPRFRATYTLAAAFAGIGEGRLLLYVKSGAR